MDIKEKIKEILKFYNLKQKGFAEKIGITPQMVSDVLTGKKNAGDKIINGILDNCQEINPLWLFRDSECMLINDVNGKKQLSDFSEEEIALYIVNNESKFMEIPIFSNMVEKIAALKAIDILNKA
ncbi:helix-turn-helix domain-containing protein [Kordia sp.]|uniref:helix-turn-helix domain-containing protein n=1 Tax=Kordia sp. TaxID=1965332 RepID=UPI003D2C4F85